MSDVVTIKISDEAAKYVANSTTKYNKSVDEVVSELLKIGFEWKLKILYRQYRRGVISLGWLAQELGLSVRDAYHLLESRNLPLSAGVDRVGSEAV